MTDKYDVIILNFANCDMVGHTGVFDAAVKAVEAADDRRRARLSPLMLSTRAAQRLITADHGNADQYARRDDGTYRRSPRIPPARCRSCTGRPERCKGIGRGRRAG